MLILASWWRERFRVQCIIERMDCQVLMGVFVYVCYSSFVQSPDVDVRSVIDHFLMLSDLDQLSVFEQMREIIALRGQ